MAASGVSIGASERGDTGCAIPAASLVTSEAGPGTAGPGTAGVADAVSCRSVWGEVEGIDEWGLVGVLSEGSGCAVRGVFFLVLSMVDLGAPQALVLGLAPGV